MRDLTPFAIVFILVLLLAAGPGWGKSPSLGEGTANVTVVEPPEFNEPPGAGPVLLHTSSGRFGAAPTYVRTPTLVADVTAVEGRPKLVYILDIPALNLDGHAERLLTRTGRYVFPMDDEALPPPGYDYEGAPAPVPGTYTGRLVVRVQSFTSDRVVLNRSVTVEVRR